MNFGEFYSLLAMLLSHVVVHIPILSPFLFRQSIYILYIFLVFKSKDFKNICNNGDNNNDDNIKRLIIIIVT